MFLAPPSNLFYPNHHPITSSSDMGCAISKASLSMVVLSPRGNGSGEFSSPSAAAGVGGLSFKANNSNKTGGRKQSIESVDRKSPQFLKEQSEDGEYLDWKRVDGKSFKNSSNKKTGDSWVRKENVEFADQEQSVEGEYLDWKRVDCKSMKKKDGREWENRVIWSRVEDEDRDDREDGIWVCPGSPSFKIYCVDNDLLVHPTHQSITIEEESEEEEEEKGSSPTNSMKEHNKGLGLGQAHRRWRIGRGFNGVRYLLNVISNPNSHHHHHHNHVHHHHYHHHHHSSNSLAIEGSTN